MGVRWHLLLVVLVLSFFSGAPSGSAQPGSVANIGLDSTTHFFVGWHGSQPGECSKTDTSKSAGLVTPDQQTCSSPGGYITSFELVNGTYGGFPAIWQVTGICNDGQRLASTPSVIDVSDVQEAFMSNMSLPQGWSTISGISGDRVDQLLGFSPYLTAGTSWTDVCPPETLISGYQGWAVLPANAFNTSCNAAGIRFQCNGTLASSAGWSEQDGVDYPSNDITNKTCNTTADLAQLTSSCKTACLAANQTYQTACVGIVIGISQQCCWLKSRLNPDLPSGNPDRITYFLTADADSLISPPPPPQPPPPPPLPDTVVNASTRFFDEWHGSPPSWCQKSALSAGAVIIPDHQTCPSPGGYITNLEILNGTYDDIPTPGISTQAVWQVAAVCNDGTRLAGTPCNFTNLLTNTSFTYPQGLSNISGRSGVWMDQVLGIPNTGLGGQPWQDLCPEGSLLSGYETWASPLSLNSSCVAAGIRFQCNGSLLAAANPSLPKKDGSSSTTAILVSCIAGGGSTVVLSSFLCCLYLRRKRGSWERGDVEDRYAAEKKTEHFLPVMSSDSPVHEPPSMIRSLSNQWRSFSRAELEAATSSFLPDNILGEGAFGRVYRGCLADGTIVAIKELKGDIQPQQQKDFLSELRVLSRLRHRNLVALYGYTYDQRHMYLVFECAKNGSLDAALRGASKRALSWEARLRIAVGAARGLSYLHNDVKPTIIHRDVKPSNILLDDNLDAQVADFGMAKLFSVEDIVASIVSVRGTLGYLAPEYARFGRVGPKSDVYSFGIVLMELVTASRAVESDPTSGRVESLVEKVLLCGPDDCASLVDPQLQGAAPVDHVKAVFGIACRCVQIEENSRPSMLEVLRMLERLPGAAAIDNPSPRTPSSIGDRWSSLSIGSDSQSCTYEVSNIRVGR